MKHYPLFLNLQGKRVVVVGGGQVAKRKVDTLLKAGAKICLISPEVCPQLKKIIESNSDSITISRRKYRPEDLNSGWLLFVATDNRELNHQIYKAAKKQGIWVNIADEPSECDFIVPSTIHRGDLTLAISAGGESPSLCKQLRLEFENILPRDMGLLVESLGEIKRWLQDQGIEPDKKRRFLKYLCQPHNRVTLLAGIKESGTDWREWIKKEYRQLWGEDLQTKCQIQ